MISTTQLKKYAQLKFAPFLQEDCSENNQTYWRNHRLDFRWIQIWYRLGPTKNTSNSGFFPLQFSLGQFLGLQQKHYQDTFHDFPQISSTCNMVIHMTKAEMEGFSWIFSRSKHQILEEKNEHLIIYFPDSETSFLKDPTPSLCLLIQTQRFFLVDFLDPQNLHRNWGETKKKTFVNLRQFFGILCWVTGIFPWGFTGYFFLNPLFLVELCLPPTYNCYLPVGAEVGSPQLQVSLKTQLLEESIRIWAPVSQKEGCAQMGGEMTFGNNRGCGVRQLGGCFK